MAFYLRGLWQELTMSDIARQFIKTFESPSGTVVLHYLANKYHLLSPHGGDPRSEGQREVVLEITRLCNFTVKDFDLLEESRRERQHGEGHA